MRIKMLSFLFLFASMCFVLFVCVKSFCKKKRVKFTLITLFVLLLTCTSLNLPLKSYLYTFVFVCDHLWESLLFMRIFLNLFLIMIICKNFFESSLIYDRLWESLFFFFLLQSFFIITIFFIFLFIMTTFF